MITNKQFVSFIKKAYETGYVYWYGTYGKQCTKSLYNSKKAQYPAHYTESRTSKYMQHIAEGRTCADCIGLAKNVVWSGGVFGATPKYATNGMPDHSANDMFEYAKKKGLPYGAINTIPEIPGVAVRYNGHVGYYIGNGEVIEERGFSYGCVKTLLKDRKWTDWYYLPGVTYEIEKVEETPAEPQKTQLSGITGYVNVLHGSYYVRIEPNKNSSSLTVVHDGDKVDYLGEQDNGWFKVSVGGKTGWLSSKAGILVSIEQKYLTVKKGSWNVRTAPNTNGSILGTVHEGDKLLYQGEDKDGWHLVIYKNQNGWVSSKAIVKE